MPRKGGRMRPISPVDMERERKRREAAYQDNDAPQHDPDVAFNNDELEDSFMSSDSDDSRVVFASSTPHYDRLVYFADTDIMMTAPMMVFNEYMNVLSNEDTMQLLAHEGSLEILANEITIIINYIPSRGDLQRARYYLTNNQVISQFPEISQEFLAAYHLQFENRINEIQEILNYQARRPRQEGGRKRKPSKKRTTLQTRRNVKKKRRTRKRQSAKQIRT